MKTNRLVQISVFICLLMVSVIMLYPFIWMFLGSFKSSSEILANPLSIWPKNWDLSGYSNIKILSGKPLSMYFKNSLIIAMGTTLVVVLSTSLGAYSYFRNPKLIGSKAIQNSFMIGIMYPAVLLLIPLYVMSVNMKLYGTTIGIIIMMSTGAWGAALPFYLFRQFFKSIPYSIVESAQIDGATELQIFSSIIIPLARPVFTTAILISFLFNWGAWLPVLMLSKDMSTFTLAAALVNINSELGIDFQTTMALSTVVTLPVMVIFLLTQKKVMDGISAGGVKG